MENHVEGPRHGRYAVGTDLGEQGYARRSDGLMARRAFPAFVHPFDTWADLSRLVEVENQPGARGVHYFCSVLPERDVPAMDGDGDTW